MFVRLPLYLTIEATILKMMKALMFQVTDMSLRLP